MAIKYQWLAERLEQRIKTDIQKGVHRLPTEQALAKSYQVSRQTVRTALALLEAKGFIEKRQGSGSYITGLLSAPEDNRVGILIPSEQDYIYPALLHDIQSALSAEGFSLQCFVTGNQHSREREILQQLMTEPPRVLIIEGCKTALPNPNLDLYRRLMKKDCRIVFLRSPYPDLADCSCVRSDSYTGSALLVRQLTALGHQAIGAIFPADDREGLERYQGFAETLYSLGLSLPDDWVGWYSARDLHRLLHFSDTRFLREMLHEWLPACTAIVCFNDFIAHYLADECRLADCHVPGDLTLAAYEHSYLSRTLQTPVLTLSADSHALGRQAAQAAIHLLQGASPDTTILSWS